MKNKLYIILIVSLICILGVSTNDIYAANLSGDELLQVNGNTISKNTTITQINNMFGQPKLTTNSAFGGKAYTYYDDAYTWMLHIETNENGNIKGYGCVNGNFISRRYAQGDKYTYTYSYMSGTVLADDNDLVNGVYEYNVTASEVEEYKERSSAHDFYLDNDEDLNLKLLDSGVEVPVISVFKCSNFIPEKEPAFVKAPRKRR